MVTGFYLSFSPYFATLYVTGAGRMVRRYGRSNGGSHEKDISCAGTDNSDPDLAGLWRQQFASAELSLDFLKNGD